MKRSLQSLVALGATLASSTCLAQSAYQPVHFMLGVGLTGGGEELAEVYYDNGDSESISTGGTLVINGGLLVQLPNSPLDIQLTYGYQFDDSDAENANIYFERYPIDLMLFNHLSERMRIGLGLTRHLDPVYRNHVDYGYGDYSDIKIEFEDADGLVFEFGYLLTPEFLVSARYTQIDYQPRRESDPYGHYDISRSDAINGDHIGVYFHFIF